MPIVEVKFKKNRFPKEPTTITIIVEPMEMTHQKLNVPNEEIVHVIEIETKVETTLTPKDELSTLEE
jgi:hypothetical protein